MSRWWNDPQELRAAVQQYGTPTGAARALGGCSGRTAREAWNRLEEGQPQRLSNSDAQRARHSGASTDAGSAASSRQTDDTLELTSVANPQNTKLLSPEEMIEEATGGSHELWDFTFVKNQWDVLAGRNPITGSPEVSTMHQLKVSARRRPEALLAIELPEGWRPHAPAGRTGIGGVELVPLFADPHFPLHEPDVVDASLAWLAAYEPSRVVCLGDEGDWSPFKRHRANRRTDTTVEQAVLGTFGGLAAWRQAAPDAEMHLIPGNHTAWLEQRVLEMFPTLMAAKPPGEDEPLISMRRLLKLDELYIQWHGTTGEYHDAVMELAPGLVLMHGTRTGKGGGAVKEQERWEQASIIQGHDHALALTAINRRLPDGGWTQRYAVSAGAMSSRDLGYSPSHDVGQGWPVVAIWPDGRWHVDFALYDPVTRSTTWRDWRYDAA